MADIFWFYLMMGGATVVLIFFQIMLTTGRPRNGWPMMFFVCLLLWLEIWYRAIKQTRRDSQ